MSIPQESILRSAFRALIRTAFTVFGVFLGLIPVFFFIAGISVAPGVDVRPHTSVQMAPDADGQRRALEADTPLVLHLDIRGVIGDERLNSRIIDNVLQESQEAPLGEGRIRAIFLRINTPGGTVTDSDGIYRSIKRYKELHGIPVYAYVDGLCASGGMYVSSAADRVYASSTSLVGSVGVVIPPFFNFSQAMDKWGVVAKTISAGTNKDALNPTRPWAEGEEQNLVDLTQYLYTHFVDLVVSNRSAVDRERLVSELGARVYPATEAQKIGFIDGVEDNPGAVLEQLIVEADLENEDYQVVMMESRNWLSDIFSLSNPLLQGRVKHEMQVIPGLDARFSGQFLYLYAPSLEMMAP